jgi:hypothetical protein
MEMAVLVRPMGMVVVLRMGFGVIDIARRVMIPLRVSALTTKNFADHVVSRPGKDPYAFKDFLAGHRHDLKLFTG